jgi:sodium/potassium-transporting ATPase subunit alpha
MLTADEKNKLTQTYCSLASRGERVLGFGYKQTSTAKVKEDHFIFLGLVGLTDPPRKEVKEAIRKATSAGIRVIMITGDHTLTAESIAQKIGLINGKPNMVTGDQLKNMPQKRFRSILQKENLIFARTNPFQKLQIVRALKELGEIVTVTGDGVNDAPALKHADMGVSMGISGTEVAREASDMVLMDDNFATIVNAIEEGRTIFDNIKKFIAYILTSNVPQILPFIAFVLLGIPLPLTIVLILAIDLGTDLLPALGLGNEAPEEDVMRKKPRGKNEKLLTKNLLIRSYGIIGVLQAAAGFCSYFFVLYNGGWVWGQSLSFQNPLYQKAVTAFFASVIICQVADVLICRTRRQSIFRKGFFTNKLLYWGIISELLILAVIVYLPFTHSFFGTAPLSLFELLLSVPFALIIFFGDEVRKIYIRRKNKFFIKYLTW